MALPKVFTKTLSSASSNNLATSQSGSAGVPLVLNGSATSFLSTTTTAASTAGSTTLALNSVAGIVFGATVTDSTSSTALASQTKVTAIGSSTVQIWPPVSNTVGSGDTIVFAGIGTIDSATAANSAIGRRVVVAYTGTDTSFTVVGTNSTGNPIVDTIVGSSGAGQSNMDFVTVTSITPVGGGLTAVTAGTNGVGSSPWWITNFYSNNDVNIGFSVEIITGSVNYTVQHTYDDPTNLQAGALYPEAFNHAVVNGAAVSEDGSYVFPVAAIRVLINSGTGEIRARFLQAGIG